MAWADESARRGFSATRIYYISDLGAPHFVVLANLTLFFYPWIQNFEFRYYTYARAIL